MRVARGLRRRRARQDRDADRGAAFRYRGDAWPGFARAVLENGEERQTSCRKSWGEVLSRHIQFHCKICVDGVAEDADIAFADTWETDDAGHPLFDEAEGVSLVRSRTQRGESAATAPLDPSAIDRMQPGQLGRRSAIAARLIAAHFALSPVPSYRGLAIFRAAGRHGGARWVMRNFLGTLRRVMTGAY